MKNTAPLAAKRVLFLTLDSRIDRRNQEEASTLVARGYDVLILARRETADSPMSEIVDGVKIERIPPQEIQGQAKPYAHYKIKNWAAQYFDPKKANASNRLAFLFYCFLMYAVLLFANVVGFFHSTARRIKEYFIPKLSLYVKYEVDFFISRGLQFRPDFIHVNDAPNLPAGIAIKKKLGSKIVYDMHEYYLSLALFSAKDRKYWMRKERRWGKCCDVMITVNPMLAKVIEDELHHRPISVVQNAIPAPPDLRPEACDLLRAELGIAESTIIVLYQGGYVDYRNLPMLIEGMTYVKRNAVLVMLGEGYYEDTLRKTWKDTDAKGRVFLLPMKPQEQLLYYSASADIGVIPYPATLDPNTRFCSPNKLYEFITSRLPILCNDLPFVSSVVLGNGFGKQMNMVSAQNFAEAVDAFSWEEIEQARENLTAKWRNFTWETEQYRLLEVYSSIDPDLQVEWPAGGDAATSP